MRKLLPALEGLDPAYLVGGAVRDLLLGGPLGRPRRGGGGRRLAVAEERGADRLGGEPRGARPLRHRDRADAGTSPWTSPPPGARPTSARARCPRSRPAGLDEDLGRRDFTVNAMAIALTGDDAGRAARPPRRARRPRGRAPSGCCTTRASSTTPRGCCARCATRRGWASRSTATPSALARGRRPRALATVSGARVRDELLDLLAEDEAPAAVDRMRDLGIAAALHPSLRADGDLVAAAQLASAETGADRGAERAGGAGVRRRRRSWSSAWASARPSATGCCARPSAGRSLAPELAGPAAPSELHALLSPEPPEALALALAFGAPAEAVLQLRRGHPRRAAGHQRRRPASPRACRSRPPSARRWPRRCAASSTARSSRPRRAARTARGDRAEGVRDRARAAGRPGRRSRPAGEA